jgi:ATP synthase protein I
MEDAARRASQRADEGARQPEPSLGQRLGQIGVLGWTIVMPMLLGLFAGRWLDRRLHTGIFYSAPLLMLGAVAGGWAAWKWMHRKL